MVGGWSVTKDVASRSQICPALISLELFPVETGSVRSATISTTPGESAATGQDVTLRRLSLVEDWEDQEEARMIRMREDGGCVPGVTRSMMARSALEN